MFQCTHRIESDKYQFRCNFTPRFQSSHRTDCTNFLLDVILFSRIHSDHRSSPLPSTSPHQLRPSVYLTDIPKHTTLPPHTHLRNGLMPILFNNFFVLCQYSFNLCFYSILYIYIGGSFGSTVMFSCLPHPLLSQLPQYIKNQCLVLLPFNLSPTVTTMDSQQMFFIPTRPPPIPTCPEAIQTCDSSNHQM